MINALDIKKSVIDKVKTKYEYPFRSNEVIEDYSKPSFFLWVKPIHSELKTINLTKKSYRVSMELEGIKDTNALLEVLSGLYLLFSLNLRVKNRVITIHSTSGEIEGDLLEFSFDLDFNEATPREIPEHEIARELIFNRKDDIDG